MIQIYHDGIPIGEFDEPKFAIRKLATLCTPRELRGLVTVLRMQAALREIRDRVESRRPEPVHVAPILWTPELEAEAILQNLSGPPDVALAVVPDDDEDDEVLEPTPIEQVTPLFVVGE